MIWTILLFLGVLSVLVLAHEWGHYYTAKKIGADVEEFGLGFPPRLFSWKGKDGMIWSLNLIPLGGFVKITGESGDERENPNSFANKKIWQRFLVLVAGVLMNFLIAWALFSIGFLSGIPAITEGDIAQNVHVRNQAITVTEVIADAPAQQAGLQIGDKVTAINGIAYIDGDEARDALAAASVDTMIVSIERDDVVQDIEITPTYIEAIEREGIGAAVVETGLVRYPWYAAPWEGLKITVTYSVLIVGAFIDIIAGLVSGAGVSADISGPVGIAVMTGEIASLGFIYILQFAAILSINLAILNILPFPALDGGRILFVLIEAIRRKPASPQLEAMIHNLGFALLMILIIVVTYRDIVNLL